MMQVQGHRRMPNQCQNGNPSLHPVEETSLADAPPAAFTLWSPRAMDVNLLHISIRLEHGTIEHSVVGVLGPGFHLVLPCLKADSNSHTTACGMCVRIVDLDVHLRIQYAPLFPSIFHHHNVRIPHGLRSHVHATVGCRVEHRDICIYERVPWYVECLVVPSFIFLPLAVGVQ
ncbi:hypothetical protein AaE_003730, partial [Aphanomyces astaci]